MRIIKFKRLIPVWALVLGLLLIAGSAQAQMTKKVWIQENLKSGQGSTQTVIDKAGAGNEVTLRMLDPTVGGTGFRWGAYASSTVADAVRILDNHDAGFGTFINLAYDPGQYFYTIFSSAGTNTPDQYVNLSGPNAAITYNLFTSKAGGITTPVFKIRFLVRTNNGAKWYVSSLVDIASPVPATSTAYSTPVNTLTWYAVTSPVNTNLNSLANGDEIALAYDTVASTPDLTKVDGGGWTIAEGKVSTATESSFKMTHLNFDSKFPYIVATPSSAYPTVPSQLVLGLGTTNGKVTLSNGNSAIGSLIVKNINILSPDGRITVNPPPSIPTTLTNNTMDINFVFNQNGNQQSTATMTIVYNNGVADETVILPILGRGVIDGTIYESFVGGGNMATARNVNPNETPQTMSAPPMGTGFTWGGYTNAVSNTGGRDMVGMNGNRLTFYGATTDDAGAGGAYHGSYAYTIFDTLTSGAVVDRTLNLHKFQYYCDNIPTGTQIRWLVRDDQNHWFMSKDVVNMTSAMVGKFVYSDVDDLTQGWLRVNQAAEDHLNALPATKATPAPQVAIGDAGTLTAGSPNLLKVTGAGVYIERGNTDPTNTPLTMPDLNFIARPSSGDTLKVGATALTESYKVPNRRLALAALTFDITSGLDAALDGVDVSVTPNTTGLRGVMLYSDPNNNGKFDDGAELTNCTLDASTAHLLFRDNQIFLAGAQRKMDLVAVFDETVPSTTYTLTIAPAQWKQDPENGGTGDTVISAPNPIRAAIQVKSASLPSTATLFTSPVFKETWEATTAGPIPTTPATGVITGADNLWNYTWGTSVNFAQIATKNGSLALGNETKDMTTEPPYNSSFRLDASLNTLLDFDAATTEVVRLKFDLVITSTTQSTSPARLSGRVVAEQSNVIVSLRSYSGGDAYNLTVYPLLDAERYMFGINFNSYLTQYAPANILAYSNNNGLGTYQYALYLAPYNANSTLARVQVKHVESGKTLDWLTVLDGKIPNLSNLRYAFGAYPNAYIDNIDVTEFVYRVNPVRRWTIFE